MSKKTVISCRGLDKSFGANVVLDGLDLDIFRGETIVVLGHSGSGKSVLLKHINGLVKPDSGSVIFDDVDVCSLSETSLFPIRRRMGMLFQGGALFDSLNVEDNVAFSIDQLGVATADERARRVAELLEVVGLGGSQTTMPSDLSGGMRKRAALARSLALDPEVMLYDEPTTGLDPVTGQQINELIRALQQRLGFTSVVVTHDLSSAAFVADRVAFLYDGRIREIGAVEELRRNEDPVIREFLSGGGALLKTESER